MFVSSSTMAPYRRARFPHTQRRTSDRIHEHLSSLESIRRHREERRQKTHQAIFDVNQQGVLNPHGNMRARELVREYLAEKNKAQAQKSFDAYRKQAMALEAMKQTSSGAWDTTSPTIQYYINLAYNRQIGVPSYFHQTFRRRYTGPQF